MANASSDQYYIRFGGQTTGPYPSSKIREMIRRDQVSRVHELSPDGQVWTRLRDLPELRDEPKPESPPHKQKLAKPAPPAVDEQYLDLLSSALPTSETKPDELREYHPPAIQNPAPAWFYAVDDAKHGPVSEQKLVDLLESGQINLQTLIWKKDMRQWMPISEMGFISPSMALPPAVPMRVPQGQFHQPQMQPYGQQIIQQVHVADAYASVPWHRRSGVLLFCIFLSLFFVPVYILPFFSALTGNVYVNAYDAQGRLKEWGWLGRGVAIAFGILIIIGFILILIAE